MQTIHTGVVTSGFQFASGGAVGRADCPFPDGTLAMQHPYFREAGLDLEALVPDLRWGTINLRLDCELELLNADRTLQLIDWTEKVADPKGRIAPETFSFIRCCFASCADNDQDRYLYYPGLLYYPHPETKPETNEHHYNVLEVLTSPVPSLQPGTLASVVCRADAFVLRKTVR